jgi:hypothetical protein
MTALASRFVYLVTLTALVILTGGCATRARLPVAGSSNSCESTSTDSRRTGASTGTAHYTRSQIARSFSGGSPTAATRVVWAKHQDTCL